MEKRLAVANFIIRIALGIIFLYSAFGKLFFGFAPPIDQILWFIPLNISTYLLGLLEFVIGVLLLAGLYTRIVGWVSTGLLIVFVICGLALGMFNAAGLIKDLGLIAATTYLGLTGSFCWSLDTLMRARKTATEAPTVVPVASPPPALFFASPSQRVPPRPPVRVAAPRPTHGVGLGGIRYKTEREAAKKRRADEVTIFDREAKRWLNTKK